MVDSPGPCDGEMQWPCVWMFPFFDADNFVKLGVGRGRFLDSLTAPNEEINDNPEVGRNPMDRDVAAQPPLWSNKVQ